jgi:signal transduction histidine kinase
MRIPFDAMRLSQFILSNLDSILAEWESFASSVLPESSFDKLALRDESEGILKTIAHDMETAQTATEQTEKSKGRGPGTEQESAAEIHGGDRFRLGFNQAQVVSEYRALRATVIRLWINSSPEIDDSAVDQLIRFNEGIDQALSESTARFMQQIEKSRDFAIAVLAHDLRNPLNAILSSAQFLQTEAEPDRALINATTTTMVESGMRMSKLIENLLDFTGTRLGQPLPVKRESVDLAPVCRQTVAEFAAAYPDRTIRLDCSSHLHGTWDATRLSQMLSNLISNAIEHGTKTTPVTVEAHVEFEDVELKVHNEGPPIPPSALLTIFDPLSRPAKQGTAAVNEPAHLGVGLFVAQQIVEAHSGKISVTSTEEGGTTFVVRLPRQADDP